MYFHKKIFYPLLVLILFAFTAQADGQWLAGYSYRKQITIAARPDYWWSTFKFPCS